MGVAGFQRHIKLMSSSVECGCFGGQSKLNVWALEAIILFSLHFLPLAILALEQVVLNTETFFHFSN